MRKTNSNDVRHGLEQSKKLYRSVSDCARHLDEARHGARTVLDLFAPPLQIQRSKLRDYCERLIFSEPLAFGRKAEELLWRKAYYDVIATAKKLKRKEYGNEEICLINMHINAGVGHYHHFVARLQYEYDLELGNYVDFAVLGRAGAKHAVEEVRWASESVHRSLVYLGDLNRYKLEIYPNWDVTLALRYYLRAAYYRPALGIPHNQIGFIAATQHRHLDAAYHYMRSLSCAQPFEGTENNLQHLFEQNRPLAEAFPIDDQNADCIVVLKPGEHIRRLICRFLYLAEIWYFAKVQHTDVYVLCHQTNVDLRECLAYTKPLAGEMAETDSGDVESDSTLTYVNDDVIFKMVVICLMCIARHKSKETTPIAFTLAIYSQLVQMVLDHVYVNVTHLPALSNGVSGSPKKVKARRRRSKKKCESESDGSDVEVLDETLSDNADESDVELCTSSDNDESEEEEEEEEEDQNGNIAQEQSDGADAKGELAAQMLQKVRQINVNDMLEIIAEEKYLASIKIVSDWLISDLDALKSCGTTMKLLLRQLIQLLNVINIDVEQCKNVETMVESGGKIALAEDLYLRDFELLARAQKGMDWDCVLRRSVSGREEAALRVRQLIGFGMALTQVTETGVSYDASERMFRIADEVVEVETVNGLNNTNEMENNLDISTEEKKLGLKNLHKMKHMGQLWLAEEVRTLESRVKGRTSLSPYLVVDVETLTEYASIIRHLVNSKKFIIVVPTIVVSALDDLKIQKSEARDAIRWLEAQFHRGNRFCRAQRPQERTPLPLIKYPKKRDKSTFMFIQIIECCHYLAQQQQGVNLVTLLVGSEAAMTSDNRDISYIGLAKSAGVNIEFVAHFYDKWKRQFRGKR